MINTPKISEPGALLAEAAGQFVGTPFRLHGRDPVRGLDCVGLISAALAATGRQPLVSTAYALRNRDITQMLTLAPANGFEKAAGPIRPGDMVLVSPGPAQWHLLIAEYADSFIHAHAGIRRVVRMPGPLGWPVVRLWRLPSKD